VQWPVDRLLLPFLPLAALLLYCFRFFLLPLTPLVPPPLPPPLLPPPACNIFSMSVSVSSKSYAAKSCVACSV
jgi:hypothetical protein